MKTRVWFIAKQIHSEEALAAQGTGDKKYRVCIRASRIVHTCSVSFFDAGIKAGVFILTMLARLTVSKTRSKTAIFRTLEHSSNG